MRGGVFDLSVIPNNTELDPHLRSSNGWAKSSAATICGDTPAKSRSLDFSAAAAWAASRTPSRWRRHGGPADIAAVRHYNSRGGVSLNLEQQITSDLGAFARAGYRQWRHRTLRVQRYRSHRRGRALTLRQAVGTAGRHLGLAGVVNGITKTHEAFLNAGGLGILVGDGSCRIPVPSRSSRPTMLCRLSLLPVTLDYQFIVNPAYNRDRGPVSVVAARLHAQF